MAKIIDITKKEIDINILKNAIRKYNEEYKKEPQFLIMNSKTADSIYDNLVRNQGRCPFIEASACLNGKYQRIINSILDIPVAFKEDFLFGEVIII